MPHAERLCHDAQRPNLLGWSDYTRMLKPTMGTRFAELRSARRTTCARNPETPMLLGSDGLGGGAIVSLYSILPDGTLAMTASESSSRHDFDFLVGGWKIKNRRLKEFLAGCDSWDEFEATQNLHQILDGSGNFDIFSAEIDGKPFEGFTLRLFEPRTRLWTIYWADSNELRLDSGKVGSFDGDIGEFFAREVYAGKNVIVKFHWDKRNPEAPVYSAAFSADEGHTWEWNWYAYFERRYLR
jgi:hypothetical protein